MSKYMQLMNCFFKCYCYLGRSNNGGQSQFWKQRISTTFDEIIPLLRFYPCPALLREIRPNVLWQLPVAPPSGPPTHPGRMESPSQKLERV